LRGGIEPTPKVGACISNFSGGLSYYCGVLFTQTSYATSSECYIAYRKQVKKVDIFTTEKTIPLYFTGFLL
jgi:hypothetical protein